MDAKFEELKGKTIVKIVGMEKDSVKRCLSRPDETQLSEVEYKNT